MVTPSKFLQKISYRKTRIVVVHQRVKQSLTICLLVLIEYMNMMKRQIASVAQEHGPCLCIASHGKIVVIDTSVTVLLATFSDAY